MLKLYLFEKDEILFSEPAVSRAVIFLELLLCNRKICDSELAHFHLHLHWVEDADETDETDRSELRRRKR